MINKSTYIFALRSLQSFDGYFNGSAYVSFKILLAFMVLDFLSGIMKAIQNRNLRSFIMSWGIMKKGGLLLSVLLSLLVDELVNGGTPSFGVLMTWFAIGNEGLSIIENLDELGVKIPEPIKDKLMDLSEIDDVKKYEEDNVKEQIRKGSEQARKEKEK